MGQETYNTRETCEKLGISRTTLWRLVRDGELTPVEQRTLRKKAPLKFDKAEVEQLLEKARRRQYYR